MEKLQVLGIAGSLRTGSYNRMLLTTAIELAPVTMAIEPFDLHGIMPFNQDDEHNPPEIVRALKAKLRSADGVLLVTPEYNYTIPGVLKDAIDWASRPYGDNAWEGKPVAVMGASTGQFGTIRAQLALRQSFIFLKVRPVITPEVFVDHANMKFDNDGNLTDEATRSIVEELLRSLAELIGQG